MTIAPISATNTHPLILAALAKPITHNVVTIFADGTERSLGVRSIAAGETGVQYVMAFKPRYLTDPTPFVIIIK